MASQPDSPGTTTKPSWHGRRFLLVLLSLAYGVAMPSLCGQAGLYSLSPYHRLQADALLHGHLYIGDSIEQLSPGLGWHNGHVQQVWGLGIGLWLLPFQAVWKLLGGQVFPDRIALGVAFALLAFYAVITGWRIARNGQRVAGLGFIWLIFLCPQLWTLTRASQLVFEETVLYGLLISLGILIALIRFTYFDSRADYWVCCVLAAFIGLVRPTQIIYGLDAVVLCSVIWIVRHRAVSEAALGVVVVVAGLVFLGVTNQTRFGSYTEFGHRLTANSDSMVYLTRFGNSYLQTRTLDAGKELFGALFLDASVRDAGAFSDNLFPGQADTTRWRRLYLTLFDPAYALFCLAAIVGGVIWIRYRLRTPKLRQRPADVAMVAIWLWAGSSIVVLGVFYLRFPIIASRYLLDFLPGLVGLLMLAWLFIAIRWCRGPLLLLAGWLVYGLAIAKVPVEPVTQRPPLETALPRAEGQPLREFAGNYTIAHHPEESGMEFNGHGWEPETGFADDVVALAVDHPEFLELRVGDRRMANGEAPGKDDYRAMMDGRLLPLRGVVRDGDQLKVSFEVPRELRTQVELLFLCFSSGYDAEDRDSERFLYAVRWR